MPVEIEIQIEVELELVLVYVLNLQHGSCENLSRPKEKKNMKLRDKSVRKNVLNNKGER